MTGRSIVVAVLVAAVVLGSAPAWADDEPSPDDSPSDVGSTPPRLSFTDGEVSFWRPGATDWSLAEVNMALAPGDLLYTGGGANVELQVGARAYVRGGEETQIGLENQEPDFLQLKVTAGHISLDLRSLTAGHTVELDTPNAAFTIERTGYYRADIDEDTTTFIARRGGSAAMTPAGGATVGIAPSEQVVVQGTDTPTVETYVAPELDEWDHWNYDRTDQLIDALSSRYVPAGVYGTDDLDHAGNWRVVQAYGPVWVPDGVAPGWVPYSDGRWVWDPNYGWTWVSNARWGWAPYHYGRWVYVDDFWAWAPGPIAAPVYAPALVAFFGGGGFGVSVGIDVAPVGWVALGWGEPVCPWWGRPGFIGRPWWGGWHGPRVINNVTINKTTVINITDLNAYRNTHVRNAVVVMRRDRFGRDAVESSRLANFNLRQLQPMHGSLGVRPTNASLVPSARPGLRPPHDVLGRGVVVTRRPHDASTWLHEQGLKPSEVVPNAPARVVDVPRRPHAALNAPRAPFGQENAPERARPPLPPRFQEGTGSAPPPRPNEARRIPEEAPRELGPRHPAAPQAPNVREAPPAQPHESHSIPREQEAVPAAPRESQRLPAEAPRELGPRHPAAPEAPNVREAPPARPHESSHVRPEQDVPPAAPRELPRVPAEAPRDLEPRHPMAPPPREAPPPRQAPAIREAPPAAPVAPRVEAAPPPARALPGEPANRLFQGRPHGEQQAPAANVPHPSGDAPAPHGRAAPDRARHRD